MSAHTRKDLSDNVYLNIKIPGGLSNYDSNSSNINIDKTIPVVENPSDYYLSVIYAKIPVDSVPITIAVPIANQPNPNLLATGLGLTNGGLKYFRNVIFSPQTDPLLFPPPQQTAPKPIITNYYFVYSITWYLNLINQTIIDLHTDAGLANPPFFYLNPVTLRITLVVHNSLVTLFAAGTYNLRLNSEMIPYFEGLGAIFNASDPIAPLIINMFDYGNTCNSNGGQRREEGVDYFFYEQDFYSLNNWICLNKIVVMSNTIPVRSETLGGIPGDPRSGQSVSMPILFDYVPNSDFLFQSSANVTYRNEGEHRLIDLIGQNPLKNINLSIGWEDYLGNIYPLYITVYKSVNIKLGFFKKELFNNSVKVNK